MQDLHSRRLREEFKRMLKTYPPKTSPVTQNRQRRMKTHCKVIIAGHNKQTYRNYSSEKYF